jgi:cytochrome c oxidase cbb3-type subunit III
MSDFDSGFWDYYVAIVTVVSVIGCAVFLKVQSKHTVKLDQDGNIDTTHHVWDGDLRELEQPMPRWWVVLFYLTAAFGLLYAFLFPGLGTRFHGALQWSSGAQYKSEMAAADARFGPMFDSFLQRDLPGVAADPRAHQIGERIFQNNCSPCHGSDAHGARGFPDLTDATWIWGGTPEAIEATITNGREGLMPPMAEAIGSESDVIDVAHFVLSLSKSPHEASRVPRT